MIAKPSPARDTLPGLPDAAQGDSTRVTARPDLQGRRFRHNGQLYLPTWEVRERIPVDTSTLIYWHDEGCHYLEGKALRARRDKRGWRAKMKHPPWGWHAGDVDKIVRARASEPGVYKDRDYIRLRDAVRAFGFPGPTIQGWAKKGCPHLGGRKLRRKPLKGIGQGPREVKGYSVADLRKVAARLDKDVDPYLLPVTNAAGTWLPAKLVGEDPRYGFYWGTVYAWHRKGCGHLDGRKLRAEWFPLEASMRGRWKKKLCFLEEDLDGIVRRRAESERGRRATASEDDEGTWLPAWLVTERYGFSAMSLHYWRKRGCWALDGAKLRSKQFRERRRAGKGWSRRRPWKYLQKELEIIEKRFAGTRQGPPPVPYKDDKGTWLAARLVREQYGFRDPILFHWRENGCCHLEGSKLRFQRVPVTKLFPKGVPRGYGRGPVLVYLQADLERIAEHRGTVKATGNGQAGMKPAAIGAAGNGHVKTEAAAIEPPANPPNTVKSGGRPDSLRELRKIVEKDCRSPEGMTPAKEILAGYYQQHAEAIKNGKGKDRLSRGSIHTIYILRSEYRAKAKTGR